jgi:hypothetical protein
MYRYIYANLAHSLTRPPYISNDITPPRLQAALIRCTAGAAPHPDLLVAARALGVPAALDELARRLFAARPSPAAAIVYELTAWAMRRDEPSIVSAVLLEGSTRLVPVGEAHLGSALGGAALESLGLPCAAAAYGAAARNFLERAGCVVHFFCLLKCSFVDSYSFVAHYSVVCSQGVRDGGLGLLPRERQGALGRAAPPPAARNDARTALVKKGRDLAARARRAELEKLCRRRC